VEIAELHSAAAAAATSRGAVLDVDLETIPDCVSLQSFRRKPSNASTLPAELRTIGKHTGKWAKYLSTLNIMLKVFYVCVCVKGMPSVL